jgi:hypothetical protein
MKQYYEQQNDDSYKCDELREKCDERSPLAFKRRLIYLSELLF